MTKRLRVRYPKRSARPAPRRPESVRAKLPGPYDLERFSFERQELIARLQQMNVQGVGNYSLYFTPPSGRGETMALTDERGRAVEALDILEA